MPTPAKKHGVLPALLPLLVPITNLETMPGNARRGDVDAVARSFTIFGQRKPLVAKRTGDGGIVIAGNHGLLAARALGWTHVAAVMVDDDDTTAKAYARADNRTSDLGGYDDTALLALLESVQSAGALEGTGFEDADIAGLMESIARDMEDKGPGIGLGSPVVSFTLVFDDEHQQSQWYRLVRMWRALYDEDSLGARISAYVEHLEATGDLEPSL